jgi:hypothetical protein
VGGVLINVALWVESRRINYFETGIGRWRGNFETK